MRKLIALVALLYGTASAKALVSDMDFCSRGFDQPARLTVPGANNPGPMILRIGERREIVDDAEPSMTINTDDGTPIFIFRDRVFWPCEAK